MTEPSPATSISSGVELDEETRPVEQIPAHRMASFDTLEKPSLDQRPPTIPSQCPTVDIQEERSIPIHSSDGEGDNGLDDADKDAMAAQLPWQIRRIVSLHDDTTLPTITFRYFLLVFLFVSPGAFLNQLNRYRTTSAPYSIFFVQIAASYAGDLLAKTLPAFEVKIPFTTWSFNLNPGPFSVKEHVLVVIAAASGATDNLAWTPISLAELYLGERINPVVCVFFMWAIVWTGYSYAAIARQFLIYDPDQPW